MEIIDSKKHYIAPVSVVFEVKGRSVLCLSEQKEGDTEKISHSGHVYGDDDFEE